MVIDGKKIAAEILEKLGRRPKPRRFLAAILVGNAPASVSFVRQKERAACRLGIEFRTYRFPEDISQDELRHEVERVASQDACGGVIVQLPLPERIRRAHVLDAIPRVKDVDVLSGAATRAFEAGTSAIFPPAAGVVQEILLATHYSLTPAKVAVVGMGFLVGRPIAAWLKG
ncbi:MAG: tetrahydrofolate dehydrogenase/cyclohydrolase catalytic domain-containing protein, partial [Patescibacteria group bacterium]